MADKKDKKEEEKKDAAPAEGAEGEAPAEGAGGSKVKKIVLFAVVPLILILGGGAAAYFTGALDGLLGIKHECPKDEKTGEYQKADDCVIPGEEGAEGEHAAEGGDSHEGGEGAAATTAFFEIPNLLVNLNSTSKQPRFLKISIKLELEKAEDQPKLEQIMPRVVDHFQTYLRELRVEDLRGSAGLYRLKLELLSRVQAAAPGIGVKDVLFQEILIQ